MPVPQNKIELREAIQSSYSKLKKDFERVPLDKTQEKTMPGHAKGSIMSPYDLLAYLVGWADLVLYWNLQFKNSESVIFPHQDFKWNELGLLAQKFYTDYPNYDFSALLEMLDTRVKEIIHLIDNTDKNTLYSDTWYKEYTIGRMIQLNTSSPFKNARKRLRVWLKENEK